MRNIRKGRMGCCHGSFSFLQSNQLTVQGGTNEIYQGSKEGGDHTSSSRRKKTGNFKADGDGTKSENNNGKEIPEVSEAGTTARTRHPPLDGHGYSSTMSKRPVDDSDETEVLKPFPNVKSDKGFYNRGFESDSYYVSNSLSHSEFTQDLSDVIERVSCSSDEKKSQHPAALTSSSLLPDNNCLPKEHVLHTNSNDNPSKVDERQTSARCHSTDSYTNTETKAEGSMSPRIKLSHSTVVVDMKQIVSKQRRNLIHTNDNEKEFSGGGVSQQDKIQTETDQTVHTQTNTEKDGGDVNSDDVLTGEKCSEMSITTSEEKEHIFQMFVEEVDNLSPGRHSECHGLNDSFEYGTADGPDALKRFHINTSLKAETNKEYWAEAPDKLIKFDLLAALRRLLCEYLNTRHANKLTEQKSVSNIVSKKTYVPEHLKQLLTNKETVEVFGLQSYFDRINHNERLTDQERMRYEWFRFISFYCYQGHGNPLVLARNGFYHNTRDGATSTRCYLCEAQRSNWDSHTDVESEHRQMSPDCPFHENRWNSSVNEPITYNDNLPNSTATSSITELTVSTTQVTRTVGTQSSHNQSTDVSRQEQDNAEGNRHSSSSTASYFPSALDTGSTCTEVTEDSNGNQFTTASSDQAGINAQSDSQHVSNAMRFPSSGLLADCNTVRVNSAAEHTDDDKWIDIESNDPGTSRFHSTTSRSVSLKGVRLRRTPSEYNVEVNNSEFPDYADMAARVNTFQNWPDHLDQSLEMMALAGFFSVGTADIVRCFCCGRALRNWSAGNDPAIEHARWFPDCAYIKRLKGEDFVREVEAEHRHFMEEKRRQTAELAKKRDEAQMLMDAKKKYCKICKTQPANTRVHPCGHCVVCYSCAQNLTDCPQCRTRIAR